MHTELQNNESSLSTIVPTSVYGVDWAEQIVKRDEATGKVKDVLHKLSASMFEVTTPPPALFGQNMKEWDFETAMVIAESEPTPESHDFGNCTIVPKSLRRLKDGKLVIDLSVPVHARRRPLAPYEQEVKDDDGKIIRVEEVLKPTAERWVTVYLDWVRPLDDHPLSKPYYQRDDETLKALRVNAQSAAIEEGRQPKPKGARAKSTRISPAAARARLAKLKAAKAAE